MVSGPTSGVRIRRTRTGDQRVGLAFGQLLAAVSASMGTVSDEHGSGIAVRGPSQFTCFPTNFIAKAHDGPRDGLIAPPFHEMVLTAYVLTRAVIAESSPFPPWMVTRDSAADLEVEANALGLKK